MKSKKGSFLVEVVVALSLISTVMAATPFVIKEVVTSTSKKYESYIANETLDSIGKELCITVLMMNWKVIFVMEVKKYLILKN